MSEHTATIKLATDAPDDVMDLVISHVPVPRRRYMEMLAVCRAAKAVAAHHRFPDGGAGRHRLVALEHLAIAVEDLEPDDLMEGQ